MTNKFLLNRSGMSPEVTSRKGRSTLESILSRFSLVSLICLCMLTLGVGEMWGADETLTLTGDDWSTGGYDAATSNTTGTKTTSGSTSIGLAWAKTYKNAGIQMKASTGEVHSTSYPSTNNKIKSIKVDFKTNTACAYGSANGSDWTEISISDNVATDVASSNYKYWKVTSTSSYCVLNSITVVYTSSAPATKYTVTYNAEGGTCGTASATESTAGGGVTLPSASPSSACSSDGWAFYGWATSACGSVTAAAPEIIGTTDDTYHPTSNTTLHAVYRKSLGSSNYNRIVSLDDLSSGSDYIFVGEYSSANYVMTNSYSTSGDYGRFAGSQINESSTGMYSAASINSNYKLTITGTTDNYYIYCAANSKYIDVGYKAMIYGSKDPADYYQIIVSNGKWKTINHYNSNYILYDGSNNIFKGSSTEYELLIYKYGPSYSYYSSPSCCTQLGSINGSFW